MIVNKRAGDITQGDQTGDTPLSEIIKEYIKEKYNKPGNVFVGNCSSTRQTNLRGNPICKDLKSTRTA